MAFNSGVDIAAVRRALNNVPEDALSDETIQQAIDRAEVLVGEKSTGDASTAAMRVAVIDIAAYRAITSSPTSFVERKEALDLTATVSVSDWIESLREAKDESLERISNENKSTLYTFGDRRQRRGR